MNSTSLGPQACNYVKGLLKTVLSFLTVKATTGKYLTPFAGIHPIVSRLKLSVALAATILRLRSLLLALHRAEVLERSSTPAIKRASARRYIARIFMYRIISGSIFITPNRMISAITQRMTTSITRHLPIPYMPA